MKKRNEERIVFTKTVFDGSNALRSKSLWLQKRAAVSHGKEGLT